jgi:hypothetical protein
MTPAERAIGAAAFVVTVALGLYAVAATLDRWPELVIAAWGAALGAGMAINGIALREMDFDGPAEPGDQPRPDRIAAVRHQVCTALVAISAWQTAEREHLAWAAATVVLGLAWAWTLPRLVTAMERASMKTCLRAYYRAFQISALVAAIGFIYASIAQETLWLWRPAAPANLQAFVWLAILEFAGLPLTLIAALTPSRLRFPP